MLLISGGKKRKLLVLDLDKTLLHYFGPESDLDFQHKIFITRENGSKIEVRVDH